MFRLPLCIVDGQSCSKHCSRGMLGYLFCIVDGQSCSSTALVGCQVYLCVLLMVKAVVVLLSWDVRLPLCIVDGQSCSITALVGC